MKKYPLLFALACLLLFSCQKDDDNSVDQTPVQTDFTENFGSSFTSNFIGRVVNENNEAIEGVNISVGGLNTITDVNGVFSIQGASVHEKFAYVKATKTGYINGSRSLVPTSGVNQVKIMLLAENVVATVATGEASQVSLPNGTEVSFAGEFVKADGSAYSGAVSVIMQHLDPMDENIEAMMPGMLFAEDDSGNARVLETYGMLAVELKGASGEKLQLADGSPAQITLPVPSVGLANAPNTIPLWHFDEENGYWKEEGTATLVNGKYVGEVSHFSFWNCDVQLPLVQLCINVVDTAGNPIANEFFMLNRTSTPSGWGANAYSYTNQNGEACGQVPIDEELIFMMTVSECNTPFEVNIGSFNSDSTITVVVDANYNVVQLIGEFNDCNNNVITNGYIQFNYNETVYYIPVTDGIISFTYAFCGSIGSDFTAQGIDVSGQQTTTIVSGTLDATIDLGVITSCGTFEDTDGDGVFDEYEDVNGDNNYENDDTDQDGIPNYNDTDDDGDGVPTADEDLNGDGDFTNDDLDGDGTPNYLDAYDISVYDEYISVCDDNNDGLGEFDLNGEVSSIIGNQQNLTVEFYSSYVNAENQADELNSPYTSASTTIYARTAHVSGLYVRITEYILEVQVCNLNSPQPYLLCEDVANTGINCNINLNQTGYILNGNTGVVTYYLSQADADNEVNPVANIDSYCNTMPNNEVIYIRVEVNGNVTIMTTEIIIDPLPNITLVSTTCDAGNATYSVVYSSDQYLGDVWSNDGTATINQNTGLGFTISGIPTSLNLIGIDVYPQNCPNNSVYLEGPMAPTCN